MGRKSSLCCSSFYIELCGLLPYTTIFVYVDCFYCIKDLHFCFNIVFFFSIFSFAGKCQVRLVGNLCGTHHGRVTIV